MNRNKTHRLSRKPSHLRATLTAMAALALVVLPTALFAGAGADDPVLSSADAIESMMNVIRPIFQIVQFVLVIAAVVLALIQGFKASRGDSRGWINAGLLLFVALIIALPHYVAGLFSEDVRTCIEVLTNGEAAANCVFIQDY